MLLALMVTLLGAAPALAQRDPFRPLVTEEEVTTETGTTTTTTTVVTTEPTRSTATSLTPTGISADVWIAAALLLFLVGSGFLVLDRYRQLA
jgi:hypothetical protein